MAGSLQKLTNNPKGQANTYKLTVSNGTGDDGKRLREYKTIHVTSDKLAEKALAAFLTEIEKGEYSRPCEYSLEDMFSKWIKSHAGDKQLAVKTEHRYKELFNLRIKDHFSQYKLEKITPAVLDEFFIKLRKAKRKDGRPGFMSEESVKHHYRLLSAVFNYAYRKQFIKSNPMVFTETIDVKKKQAKFYDEDEVSKFLDAIESADLKFKALIHLAIASGCRLGEIVGLVWDDINFEKGTINIERAAQYLSGIDKKAILEQYPETPKDLLDRNIIIKSPKTEKSTRKMTLPKSVLDLISDYQHEQKIRKARTANKWKKGPNWVFTDNFGDIMHPLTPSKWFHAFIEEYNAGIVANDKVTEQDRPKYLLKKINFHGLRHTSASLLISRGKDVVTVASRLGHSNSETTLKVYAHAFEKLDQEAAESMEGVFNKKKDIETNKAN